MLGKKGHHNSREPLCSSISEKVPSLGTRKPVQQLPGGVAEMEIRLIRRYMANEMSSVGRWSDSHAKRSIVVGFWSSLERHECGLSESDIQPRQSGPLAPGSR
jgi:proteasome lid subunit RPN8/RPN11